jgi:two-component system, cell cycle sensor histidine kinase and response regulator CckA
MASNVSPEQTTVLLVDDEQSVRSIVLKILQRAKYNVIEAENGGAALKVAASHEGPIHIVVTDMYMPGMRGPEVVDALSKVRPGLRALFMSGYADQDSRTAVPEGANFLHKPFSGQDLTRAVEAVLKGPPLS